MAGSAANLGGAAGAGDGGVSSGVGGVAGGAGLATGAGAGAAGSLSGGTPGTPDVGGAASTLAPDAPGGSTVATFTASSQGGVQSAVNVDTAANVVGMGDSAARVEGAQSTVGSAQAMAQDPSGAATSEVDGRVTGAVSERAPVDLGAVSAAGAAVSNPEEAAEGELRGAADARMPDASVNVQVQGSAGTTPGDPKK
jgi:hypothetical protein